ncbi:PQQ-binding-like beta-propeller repeat protein [Histidinibacterium aquaticum]|uniref:PQQ-binding-like beta-propeller repeat protein n=2 Tax=Histidinibacterium aquaticum TaxID=2613962 RepID=A0A5J5GP51_9RHOB|nr:PQQ-binding-like beta-propeller repeat protein [Histidinibacterium aquaticum]
MLGALALVAACSQPDVRLPGQREAVGGVQPDIGQALPVTLPAVQANASWTHRGGNARHFLAHPALPGALNLAFATPIGAGDSRRARITADPVVAGSTIFAMDARATVSAVSNAGDLLWQSDLRRSLEASNEASGGGLAYGDGVLYASTGFGQVHAVDASSGGILWTQDLGASGSAAPTVEGGLLYVAARDGRAWALDRQTGRIRWTRSGISSPSGFGGGSGPAVGDNTAVFPTSAGEVVALFALGGRERWRSFVVGERAGTAQSNVSDIAADPVIAGGRVYAGNFSGQVAAFSLADGERIWSADEGAVGPMRPVGNAVYLVNDIGQLVRLDAATGRVVWRRQLPQQPQRRGLFGAGRDTSVTAHYGPVLAGGRLIVASSDGALRQYDPRSGELMAESALPGGATTNPVVAGGTLYVVSAEGQLLAFR